MATTVPVPTPVTMRPYREQGTIDYAGLDFNPDERELPPDAMEQEPAVQEMLGLLAGHFTDFGERPDVFLSSNTILCYDPDDLNVRVAPDVYLAFGVETQAIRRRRLYLPWEAGKPPDLAVEVASASTARQDVTAKRRIYARIGVPEYWRFDPTGGNYHGQPLAGERLFEGAYRPIELTREPDGVLKGYSAVLGLYLCWARELPRLYDRATGAYLESGREVAAARLAAEAERDAAEAQVAVEQAARLAERTARRAAETRAAESEARAAESETRAADERARRRTVEAELERLRALLRRR